VGHEPRPRVRGEKKLRDRLLGWVARAPERRAGVFIDQSWFVLWPAAAPGWARRGRPPRVRKAKSWPKHKPPPSCCLYARMDALDRAVASSWHPTWNKDQTWAHLQATIAAYAARGVRSLVVFWDNAPWHHATLVRDRIDEHNATARATGGLRVRLVFLPSKSPWLMPLEPVFGQTKRAVGPRERACLADLQAAVDARLARRNADARDRHDRYLLHRLRRTSVDQH
jgi:transposase